MKLFKTTKSFCPVCKKVIETNIVEKKGAMFMEKTCLEHGNFEVKIAKHAWYYKGLNGFYNNLYGKNSYQRKQSGMQGIMCTTTCTSKCNLNCPICLAGSGEPKEDLPMDFFKEQLAKIKNRRIGVFLSGGEPTLREDLPEMIRLIKKSGNMACLFTNGVRISQDLNYLKKLKNNGLNTLYMWIDTLKNPEIYKKMRGEDFIDLKIKVLENLKTLKIPTGIFLVIVKGVNESEIGEILKFVQENKFLRTIWMRSYNYLGRCGFSPTEEFLIDEFVETVTSQSNGLFSLEDAYWWQKIFLTLSVLKNTSSNWCYQAPFILIPRKGERSLRDTFGFEKFPKVLDEFEKIWQEDKKRARRYFLFRCLPKLFNNLRLLQKLRGGHFGSSPSEHYFSLEMICSNNLLAYDIEKNQRQCINRSFDLGPENNVPRCYELSNLYGPKHGLYNL